MAYEVGTHEKLSEAAHNGSVIATDPNFLQNFGINSSDEFLNSKNEKKTIVELIKSGAKFEDDNKRPLNHFFDPTRNIPLTVLGAALGRTSPDWALEDIALISAQEYSYRDARDYLFKALSLPTELERKKNFGLTFQTLGQIIHHLQDMAQPQHVRNDQHLDNPKEFLGIIPNPFYNPSLYEDYTKNKSNNLPFDEYDAVSFDKARKYWVGGGKGLAEFTNLNFVSAGTNYKYRQGVPSPNSEYPSPALAETTTENIQTLFAEIGAPLPKDQFGNNITGEITFYGNWITDGLIGTTFNQRSSSLSIFDAELTKYNKTVSTTNSAGQVVLTDRQFTLNRFNFDAAHKFLIPRAVGYGAGLVNFFFRGRLVIKDTQFYGNALQIVVANASGAANSLKNGTFSLYYDTEDDIRKKLTITAGGAVNSVADEEMQTISAVVPVDFDVTKNTTLTLIFNGDIGSEKGIAGIVFDAAVKGGFVFKPNHTPADNISGTRLLTKADEVWSLSPENNVVGGKMDWKGLYIGQTPTQMLTWDGPDSRYFSGVFSSKIYKDGKIFSIAPAPVLGAALTKDASGIGWLIVICQSATGDLIYKRPATVSASSAMFDAVNAPEGWRFIADLPNPVGVLSSDRAWFFNGNGTEAQTMRKKVEGGLTRLKITMSGATATMNDLGNGTVTTVENISYVWKNCEWYGTSGTPGSVTETTNATTAGENVVAVDYLDGQEVLARIHVSGDFNYAYRGNYSTSGGSLTSEGTVRRTEKLTFGAISLDVLTQVHTYDRRGNSGAFTLMDDASNGAIQIIFIDLRHSLAVYKKLDFVVSWRGFASTFPMGPLTTQTRTNTEHAARIKDTLIPIYTQTDETDLVNNVSFDEDFRELGYCWDDGSKNRSDIYTATTQAQAELPLLSTYLSAYYAGNAVMDKGQNAFISFTYPDKDFASRTFNYLTDGDPKAITGIGAADASFFPIYPQ